MTMNFLLLYFLLFSIMLLVASARPSFNTTATNHDFDITCFRQSERFPAISEEVCEPLLQYLESFIEVQLYSGLDFPQTYNVREAPRCFVIIHAGRVVRDAFRGSEFGTAARKVLTECEAREPDRSFSFGGFMGFRPRWIAEVKAVATGAETNQTLVMHPPDVAVE